MTTLIQYAMVMLHTGEVETSLRSSYDPCHFKVRSEINQYVTLDNNTSCRPCSWRLLERALLNGESIELGV